MVADYGICYHDLRKVIKMIVILLLLSSAIIFHMMKFLAVIQVTAD